MMLRKKIMLADQDSAFGTVLEIALGREGYAVDTAADGHEAMELIRKNPYDIIISEVILPYKDGFQLTEWVRSEQQLDIPIIILSGHSENGIREQASTSRANRFLVKPIDLGELLDHLAALTEELNE